MLIKGNAPRHGVNKVSFERKGVVATHRQSDGEVERLNRTLLKAVRISELQGKEWKRELQDFMFQYRNTPHTVSSLSPAEWLMIRNLRGKLPHVKDLKIKLLKH